jgi:predicted dehydrogenase
MKRKIRWGIIGSGGIARRRTIPEGFVPASNAHLVAVQGRNHATNRQVAREFSALAIDTEEALLNSGIDAVYIASPVSAHRDQVLACARAGKHVLCEKPLGRSVDEAEQMLRACREANVQLGTALMMRFHAQHEHAAKLIQQGHLGTPVYARAQLSCWYPPIPNAWRQDPALGGGGSLIDMGTHCIDLLETFFGPVQCVTCFTSNLVHAYRSEDSAVAMLKFQNGALGSVDTFFCIQDNSSKNCLELYGSRGSIIASGTIGQATLGSMTAFLTTSEADYNPQQPRALNSGLQISPEPINTYRAEIESFSNALLDGTPFPINGESGLHSQKIIAACYQSAQSRCVVEIPP